MTALLRRPFDIHVAMLVKETEVADKVEFGVAQFKFRQLLYFSQRPLPVAPVERNRWDGGPRP